jgi:hypothetical protein
MNRALCILTIGATLPCWGSASAHETHSGWTYPPACCRGDKNGGDCQEIPDRIPYGDTIPSGDGRYHIRLHPTEDHANCFFAPPYGF